MLRLLKTELEELTSIPTLGIGIKEPIRNIILIIKKRIPHTINMWLNVSIDIDVFRIISLIKLISSRAFLLSISLSI
jgi:hypothetical protein